MVPGVRNKQVFRGFSRIYTGCLLTKIGDFSLKSGKTSSLKSLTGLESKGIYDDPFGMLQPNRTFSSNSEYRYGFNGKEIDNEVKDKAVQYDYGFRIYDSRIVKFLSVDPLFKEYPWNSSYAYAEGDMIRCVDVDGGEKKVANQPIGYYNEENHTTWKSVKKIKGKESQKGAYAILRIVDENDANFFVRKTRVSTADGGFTHMYHYWTEEPNSTGYSSEAKWEPFLTDGQNALKIGNEVANNFAAGTFVGAAVGTAITGNDLCRTSMLQASKWAFQPKVGFNPKGATWDFINQKFIQGKKWGEINWATTLIAGSFGKGNIVSNGLWGATGSV
jgi:RHS repeat-associated protein